MVQGSWSMDWRKYKYTYLSTTTLVFQIQWQTFVRYLFMTWRKELNKIAHLKGLTSIPVYVELVLHEFICFRKCSLLSVFPLRFFSINLPILSVLFNCAVSFSDRVRRIAGEWVCSAGGIVLTGKTQVFGGKTLPVPLCLPQIPHRMVLVRTWASAMSDWQLTAWITAWSRF
jgi:hypothetical protein